MSRVKTLEKKVIVLENLIAKIATTVADVAEMPVKNAEMIKNITEGMNGIVDLVGKNQKGVLDIYKRIGGTLWNSNQKN